MLVPRAGLEPAHLAILVFETNASTNSATGALAGAKVGLFFDVAKKKKEK